MTVKDFNIKELKEYENNPRESNVAKKQCINDIM